MADFTFRISPNIILGSYTSSRLGQFALSYGERFMLVVDPVLKEFGLTEKITQSLKDRNVDFFSFEDITDGSSTKTIEQALALAKQAHISGVISAGGGRAVNIARAVCAVFNEEHTIYEILDGEPLKSSPLPFICLETTMRDPHIFTNYIPVLDSRSKQLKLLKVSSDLCKLAVFDPNMTVSLTDNQTQSMAIETLCLAAEAYLSQKANFFSDMLAEKSFELMSLALDSSPTANIITPQEELFAQSGCMASLALGTSAPGTPSLLALCINSRHKISRSLIAAILFPYFIEDCAKFKLAKVAKIAHILNVCNADDSDEQAAVSLAENIRQRLAKANLPARLKDLSVTIEQLAVPVEDAGLTELVNTLPRSMTSDNLFELIKTAY